MLFVGRSFVFRPLDGVDHDELEAGVLADWILRDQLPVRFQFQLHKYLWGNEPGH